MFSRLLLSACVVFVVTAQVQTYTANFSTTSYSCGGGVDGDDVGCPPIGYPYYDSLYYSNIRDDVNPKTLFYRECYLVCAHSPDYLGVIPNGGPGAITAEYAKSKVVSFNFKSFWAGCTVPRNYTCCGVVQFPASCNITIKGYVDPAATVPIASQTFFYKTDVQYNIHGYPISHMAQFTASPAFSAVRTVKFTATTNEVDSDFAPVVAPPTIYMDDLVYTVLNRTV